ncbi:MAG TPA: nucleotidyltransferase domain-containing protein [Candidatus Acidoferrales bacterium]|nr:nucleotidyltransferase domain-containing protein [Candidatus Acidoferrales bacterium]
MNFKNNVYATLLYFDLFDHPLSRDEIYAFFPQKLDRAEFDRMFSEYDFRSVDGFVHLRDNDEVVTIRKHREKKAKRMLLATGIIGKFLRYFPFVRAVFLSGSLSKGVNDGDADIDLFIISAEERLWICRSFLTLFKKMFLLNSKKFLCPNYFVTEKHLEIPEKNIFTATELVTLRPLFNRNMLFELLEANRWILRFFPNFRIDSPGRKPTFSTVQRLLELPMSDGYTAKWDAQLMRRFREIWATRYPEYTQSEREFQFRSTPYSSKIHPNDFQRKVLSAYENRLRDERIERLIKIGD